MFFFVLHILHSIYEKSFHCFLEVDGLQSEIFVIELTQIEFAGKKLIITVFARVKKTKQNIVGMIESGEPIRGAEGANTLVRQTIV